MITNVTNDNKIVIVIERMMRNKCRKMNAMKNPHQIKTYSLILTILGLFLLPSCTKDAYGIAEGEKKADNAVCSCATDYAKAKVKAYTYATNNFDYLNKKLVKKEYDRLKDNIQKEKIEARRCIRNWALDQESYWYEDQLVGSDFQGVIELSNPKNCKELDLIESLVLP